MIASSFKSSGVAKVLNGLFFPLPIATTSIPISLAKLYNSTAATGSSPSPTVTMELFLFASWFSARPIVASVSTFRSIKLIPLFRTLFATSAPEDGVPVASITISNSTLSIASIDFSIDIS